MDDLKKYDVIDKAFERLGKSFEWTGGFYTKVMLYNLIHGIQSDYLITPHQLANICGHYWRAFIDTIPIDETMDEINEYSFNIESFKCFLQCRRDPYFETYSIPSLDLEIHNDCELDDDDPLFGEWRWIKKPDKETMLLLYMAVPPRFWEYFD